MKPNRTVYDVYIYGGVQFEGDSISRYQSRPQKTVIIEDIETVLHHTVGPYLVGFLQIL